MRRSAPWLTTLLQTAILIAVVGCATPWLGADTSSLPTPRRSHDITLNGRQARPIYSGSVVPGGVYTIEELRAAIARDPIVAAHYGNINLAEMRVIALTAPRSAYVSYRRGDRTYWTRNRVWLKAGETVLTDGATTVRARCGNCVSAVKQEGVAAIEPAHGELDESVVPPTPERGVDALSAEAEAGLGDLLEVPLAPELLATLNPLGAPPTTDLMDEGFGDRPFPSFGLPPLILGGGGGGTGGGGVSGFVFGGGTATTGDATTGGSTTGETTTGETTTGGFTSGDASTGSPTESGTDTLTSGATPAPEPEVLWLVACGVLGIASRRLRR
jgi:hypothetical protein